MPLTHAEEQRVLDTIDMPALLQLLDELVAIPSLDGSLAEITVQERVAAELRTVGMEVDQWEIDFASLRQHPSFSWEVERPRGLGVVGSLGAGNGPSLILNGHTDVVPAGDERLWRFPPWRATVADGRVYGRGALDMKGGLACAIAAAKAIQAAGVALRGRLLIQSVIGEEDGGCGTLASVLRGHTADAAIIMEPTELCIAPAQAGALNFRVSIPGLAAHGCVREEGVSAIEKFFPIYQAIIDLERERNAGTPDPLFARYRLPYGICIGRVEAGNWASTVAELLACEGRFGVAVGEDLLAARRQLEQRVAAAAATDPWLRDHPPILEWWGGQFAPAAIPTDHPLVGTVAAAFQSATGMAPILEGMTYGADMRLLVNDGSVPTVMFGPGNVRMAHKPDEYVPLADLEVVTRTLALTILRMCA
ncbi:MAG: ArgE/DapE family deacylase [Roseiflexaceae bacterium]